MQVNEVGILLIQPSPVKKFGTLDTPKVNEVGILLIRPSPVSGNPLKVYCDMSRYGGKKMNFLIETRGLQQEYIWSWLFLLSLQISFLCFESNLLQNY